MTCEDCIHYDVCDQEGCHNSDDERAMTYCADFKNKYDIVKVVRCKDCANGCHKSDTTVMCKIWNRLMITEDYCSYGGLKQESDIK